jgi:hypothetical protein
MSRCAQDPHTRSAIPTREVMKTPSGPAGPGVLVDEIDGFTEFGE